jgi:hypothetical protein
MAGWDGENTSREPENIPGLFGMTPWIVMMHIFMKEANMTSLL